MATTRVSLYASNDGEGIRREQLMSAQKALSALKLLKNGPKIVVRTELYAINLDNKFIDDNEIMKGVESGLRFWDDEEKCQDEEKYEEDDYDDYDEEEEEDDDGFSDYADDEDDDLEVEDLQLDPKPQLEVSLEIVDEETLFSPYEQEIDTFEEAAELQLRASDVAGENEYADAFEEIDAPANLSAYQQNCESADLAGLLWPPAANEQKEEQSAYFGSWFFF